MSKKVTFISFIEESKEPFSDEDEDDNDDVEPISEFRFVPSDKSACECCDTDLFSICPLSHW